MFACKAAHGGSGLTACRFSTQQLASAAQQSLGVADDNYTSFRDALRREYGRQQAGGCVSIGAVRVPAGSQLILKASPTKARAGRRTRFKFTVTVAVGTTRRAVAGARVSFAGRRATTTAGGRAKVVKKFSKKGRPRATATLAGLLPGKAKLKIAPAKKKRRR